MLLKNFQNQIIKEFQASKMNVQMTDEITLPIKPFLKEMTDARKKADKNCSCLRCKNINFFRKK